jgi:hypothetical protein
MAIDKGYLGSVYIGALQIGEIIRWNFNPETRIAETTSFGSAAATRSFTISDASGSFDGNADQADTTQNALMKMHLVGGTPAAVFLYLYVSGSKGYYGNALVTPSKSADAGGLQTFSAQFVQSAQWMTNIA